MEMTLSIESPEKLGMVMAISWLSQDALVIGYEDGSVRVHESGRFLSSPDSKHAETVLSLASGGNGRWISGSASSNIIMWSTDGTHTEFDVP